MNFWTMRNLRAVTGGSWLRKPAGEGDEMIVAGVSTDTRVIKPGQAFVALRGERFDAHDFLDSAVSAGAALIVVDRADKTPDAALHTPTGPAVLRVADTLKALGQLAAAYRRTLEGTKVIAVVGSNGKTTTVRLIDAALSTRLRGSASPKSFNNEVGVPVTILSARPGDQYLVCEVGSNHPGETARLGRIVQPDVVVVTGIGRDHVEFFQSLSVVAKEHASIFADLREGGTAVLPHPLGLLEEYARTLPSVVSFGTDEGATVHVTSVEHAPREDNTLGLRLTIAGRTRIDLSLIGAHNALNAAAAFAVGRRLGLDEPSIARGLAGAIPADMRLNQRTIGGVRLLIDCYNANPESVIAAAAVLADMPRGSADGRRVFVLGDMLEMGERSDELHGEIGAEIARRARPDLFICVGPAARHAAEAARDTLGGDAVRHFENAEPLCAKQIAALLREGDVVLLKASRGVKLERVVTALEAAQDQGAVVVNTALGLLAGEKA